MLRLEGALEPRCWADGKGTHSLSCTRTYPTACWLGLGTE